MNKTVNVSIPQINVFKSLPASLYKNKDPSGLRSGGLLISLLPNSLKSLQFMSPQITVSSTLQT